MASTSNNQISTIDEVIPTIDIMGLVRPVLSRWKMIFLITALFIVLGIVFLFFQKELYRSTALLEVGKEQSDLYDFAPIRTKSLEGLEDLKTVESKFASPALLLKVVKDNKLDKDPVIVGDIDEVYEDSELVELFGKFVQVGAVRGTRFLQVGVEHENPDKALELNAAIIDAFRERSAEQDSEVSRSAQKFLVAEADRLKEILAASEEKLQKFKEENGVNFVVTAEDRDDLETERIKGLLIEARNKRISLGAEVTGMGDLSNANVEAIASLPGIDQRDEIVDLRQQITDKEAIFAAVKKRYKLRHPTYIRAQTEIRELQGKFEQRVMAAARSVQSEFQSASDAEKRLNEELTQEEGSSLERSKLSIPVKELQREVEVNRVLYEKMLNRLGEAGVDGENKEPIFRVDTAPMVSYKPVKPKKALLLAVATILGLGAGVVTAFAFEFLDQSLSSVEDIERELGISSIAAIPKDRNLRLNPSGLILMTNPNAPSAEGFRSLRASLGLNDKSRSVAFVSAIGGEGKTTCAANYAVGLAQQGFRTLLIDGNLRNPKLDGMFTENAKAGGLSDYLHGEANPSDICRWTSQENLYLVPAGQMRGSTSELLSHQRFGHLVKESYLWFDKVVIDSPALGSSSDALILSKEVDSVALVIEAGKTSKRDGKRAVKVLNQTGSTLEGFVLNFADKKMDTGFSSRPSNVRMLPPAPANGVARLEEKSSASNEPKGKKVASSRGFSFKKVAL